MLALGETLGEIFKYPDFCILLLEIQILACNKAWESDSVICASGDSDATGHGLHLEVGSPTLLFHFVVWDTKTQHGTHPRSHGRPSSGFVA